ncbi:MAG: hypothetical protein NTU43_00540 [Bacteroidetes bacterium]|nr:hypothetical protein [Bacteroidota bacterium]
MTYYRIRNFLLSLIVMVSSCNREQICDYDPTCSGKYYGKYKLNDSTKYWIPIKIDSVVVTNNYGVNDFMQFRQINSKDTYRFYSRTEHYKVDECEGETHPCTDYCVIDKIGWEFSSSKFVNLNISIKRLPVISIDETIKYSPDTQDVYSKGDILEIIIKNRAFRTNFLNSIFYDKVNLNSTTSLDSVYEVTNSDYSPYSVYPVKVYITKGKGLVGFVFNNGEGWKLDIK